MALELSHPLLHMLRRIETAAPTIRRWSAHWAEANLLPILRDIRDAMDRPDLTPALVWQYVRPLQKVLRQREDTKPIAELPEVTGPLMGVDDDRPDLPDVVILDRRIPNEIRREASRLIEQFPPTPPAPPADSEEKS